MRDRTLFDAWYRRVVSGLYPARQDSGNRFQGTAERLAGLTMQSLTQPPGVPVPFSLRLAREDGDMVLRYEERGGANWVLERWPHAERAYFRYGGGEGDRRADWPPQADFTGPQPPQLPASVALHVERGDGNERTMGRVWQAEIRATCYVRPSVRDIL